MTGRGVLMVTGAYWPEVSGASLQCRHLMGALRGRVRFTVLTTTTDASLPRRHEVDDVPVWRVPVGGGRGAGARAALALARAFVALRPRFDVLHLHGFSRKSLLVIGLARVFGKRVLLKLTSVGEDDPLTIRARGRLAAAAYGAADVVVGVSPEMERRYYAAGLARNPFRLIRNGVDVERFRPASVTERADVRRALGLAPGVPVVLFVGYFSRDKRPDLLFEAWARAREVGVLSTLVFVGATQGRHPEIDPALARDIRNEAERRGLAKDVVFMERVDRMEDVYRAADVFALPSVREGLSNALLEAMACGLPCVATCLPGVTDHLLEHDGNGWLVPPDGVGALTVALRRGLEDAATAAVIRERARRTIEAGYTLAAVSEDYLALYRALGAAPTPPGPGR